MIAAFIDKHLRWIILGLGVALAVVALLFLSRCDNAQQREAGATAQKAADSKETLNRVEKGNDARQTIEEGFKRDDGRNAAVYDQCLQSARNPEQCKRFLPVGSPD